jgi:hypothetical protein
MAQICPENGTKRERAKQGGYKTFWQLEDLQAIHREINGELETLLNVRLDGSETYRLVGRVILKLKKADEKVMAIKKIYEAKE